MTQPFWAAARRRELVRPRCEDCGRSFFTPQGACPHCLSERWTYVPSSGRGRVYSYTICHRAPTPGFDVPYVLAIIDLEEGWSMLSNLETPDPATVGIGMEVEVGWLEASDDVVLPVFVPVAV